MKVVIEIDDDLYTRLFDSGENYVVDMRRACVAIRKGTPLPKGHGELIDRGQALNECYNITVDGERFKVVQYETLLGVPTIIEADNVESENKE